VSILWYHHKIEITVVFSLRLYHGHVWSVKKIFEAGLSQIFGRFTPHRPEEPVLGKPKAQKPSTACLRRCEKSRRFSPPKILDRPFEACVRRTLP